MSANTLLEMAWKVDDETSRVERFDRAATNALEAGNVGEFARWVVALVGVLAASRTMTGKARVRVEPNGAGTKVTVTSGEEVVAWWSAAAPPVVVTLALGGWTDIDRLDFAGFSDAGRHQH